MNAAARLLNQGSLSRGWVITVFLNRTQFAMFALITCVLLSALSVVYVTNASRSLNANIQQILTERDQLHIQWGQLLLERSTWIMQARIQHVAENKLGMMIPDNKSVVVVNE
jgi:cell division protein FtsL